jgi:hypothetical protein
VGIKSHGGIKIEAYSVAQARNQHRLDLWMWHHIGLSDQKLCMDVPPATANQRFAVISSKYFHFYSLSLAHRGAVAVWTAASTRRDTARQVIVAGSAGGARGAVIFDR